MSDVEKTIQLIVEVANKYRDEILNRLKKILGPDFTTFIKNSLALILIDEEGKKYYGFKMVDGVLRMVTSKDEVKDCTAVIITDKNFFYEFLSSDDPENLAYTGYFTYRFDLYSKDGKNFVHFKNLMLLLKVVKDIIWR